MYPLIKRGCLKMYCTPKVRQKKSNFWGVFIMKLTYEDKVQIDYLWKALSDLNQKRST